MATASSAITPSPSTPTSNGLISIVSQSPGMSASLERLTEAAIRASTSSFAPSRCALRKPKTGDAWIHRRAAAISMGALPIVDTPRMSANVPPIPRRSIGPKNGSRVIPRITSRWVSWYMPVTRTPSSLFRPPHEFLVGNLNLLRLDVEPHAACSRLVDELATHDLQGARLSQGGGSAYCIGGARGNGFPWRRNPDPSQQVLDLDFIPRWPDLVPVGH